MTLRKRWFASALALVSAVAVGMTPASALGLKDCSDAYSAAKTAGKIGTKTFAEYQKSECGPDAKPVAAPAATATPSSPAATPKATPAPTATAPAATEPAAKTRKPRAKAAAATPAVPSAAPAASPVFPTALSASSKGKKPSKARLATCVEQYRANKVTNANGGRKWIQKGGGYWSECNKKLKEIKAV